MVPYHRQKRTKFFRSVNINRYIGSNKTIRRTGVFHQGVFSKACKKWGCYVETFDNIRNITFTNYLVTTTDPMELDKQHRHSNQYIHNFVLHCMNHKLKRVMFISSWGMRVVYFQMKVRLYEYILDILKTQLLCVILQTVYPCNYYLFIFCKYCSLVSIVREY
jgi:hypothetical protein